ncbi:ABC transporter ATP-binding protein [Novacetimonas cocois]|uniref:ABC transporter ATP-binding protein n=1 Tax=Novacetimonas cocois TaxID=1747507 RepID=UPI001EEFDE3C|nr:ABC transporter ATP-binding protein [Novacetimonas cocois]
MQALADDPLRIEGLVKTYGNRRVLDGIDLTVHPGEITALLGPNGAGKTTLIGCLLGLLTPDAGSIRLWGEAVEELAPQTRARIGFVPQALTGFTWFRVRELMDYLALYRERPGDPQDPIWEEWAALDPAARVRSLSGGERQRLAIVLALRFMPDLIVLDEPVASLDPQARHDFMRLLPQYARRQGASVLISSHIISDLENISDRVVIMRHGQVRLDMAEPDIMNSIRSISATPSPKWGLEILAEEKDGPVWVRGWREGLDMAAADAGIAVAMPELEHLFLALSR